MYPPVSKELPEQSSGEVLVFQWFTVVRVPGCERPLYDSPSVVNDDVQFETVEPSHSAFALAAHPLMVLWLWARFMWHDASGVESTIEMPVHFPNAHVWRNNSR